MPITFSGTTGQTLYARIDKGGTLVACALTEGTSGSVGSYTATDAALVTAGLPSSGGPFYYNYRIFSGSPSTTAADTLKGYSSTPLIWLNGVEVPPGQVDGRNGRIYYVAPTAFGTMTLSSPSAAFSFAAKSTGTAASTEGNGTKTIAVVQNASESTAYNTSTDVLTVNINISGGHNTVAALRTVINAGSHFTAFPSTSDASTITTSTTGSGTLSGAIDSSDAYSGLSKATPFASVGYAANTAAVSGDTIWLMSGNHADTGAASSTPFVTISKDNIQIRGESQSLTIINDAGFDSGIWLTGMGNSCRQLKVVGTNPGDAGIYAAGDWSTVEDVDASSKETGVQFEGNYAVGRRIKAAGGRYGIKVDNDCYALEQCSATTDGSFTLTANSNFACIYIGAAKIGTIKNCTATGLTGTTTSSGKLIGLSAGAAPVVCDNLKINVANIGAGLTGGVYGITNLNAAASIVQMNGGSISAVNTQGTATEIDGTVSGSYIGLRNCLTTAANWTGASNIHTQLESTTPGTTIDVASTGEVGLDFNNIKDATGSHTLTNITVPTVTTTGTATNLTNAPSDSSGTTTLLGRLTGARAGYLDNVNNSALQTTAAQTGDSFTRLGLPAGASIAADINTSNNNAASALSSIVTLMGGGFNAGTDTLEKIADRAALLSTQTSNDAIKAKTDQLTFTTPNVVDATSGAGSSFTDIERAQILAALSVGQDIGVPKSLVWSVARKDGDFKPTSAIVKNAGDGVDVAVDFRNVLGSSDAITPSTGITSITLTTGSGLTSPAFSDPTQATLWMNSAVRFHIAAGTAGTTYTVTLVVNTVGGSTLSVPCQVTVK